MTWICNISSRKEISSCKIVWWISISSSKIIYRITCRWLKTNSIISILYHRANSRSILNITTWTICNSNININKKYTRIKSMEQISISTIKSTKVIKCNNPLSCQTKFTRRIQELKMIQSNTSIKIAIQEKLKIGTVTKMIGCRLNLTILTNH